MITKVKEQKDPTINKVVSYEMTRDDILHYVPLAEDNTDYQEIQTWVADGNTIESAD